MTEYEVELPVRVRVVTDGGALAAHKLALQMLDAVTDRTDTREDVYVRVPDRGYWPSRVRETLNSRLARQRESQ